MTPAVLMFPGQGAQKVGMGKELAEHFPAAREVFQAVDDALGMPLSRLMWEGPEEELTLTHNAQPAVVTHSVAVYAVVKDALTPAAAAGHSVGEYSAYTASGALSVAAAARLVRRRGELMLAAGKARAGTMAAVVGLPTEAVEQACREASGDGLTVVPANINTPEQTVLSGDQEAVSRAAEACKAAGAKRVLPLKVSGAFHSPLMLPALAPFGEALDAVEMADPAFPVVSSARVEAVRDVAAARRVLADQLAVPVRWVECLAAAGRLAGEGSVFVELGPGKVLSGLLKRIIPGATALSCDTVADVETLMERAA